MAFFNSAVTTLQTIVIGLGGALCVWDGINLLEGYEQDNPEAKGRGFTPLLIKLPRPVRFQRNRL